MDIVTGKGMQSVLVKLNGSISISIPKGMVVYCDCIVFPDHDKGTISIKLKSTGNPNVLVEIEEALNEPQENQPDPSSIVPDDAQPVFPGGIVDNAQHHYSFKIGDLQYLRVKLTEQSNLIEDTVANISISSKS